MTHNPTPSSSQSEKQGGEPWFWPENDRMEALFRAAFAVPLDNHDEEAGV